MRHFRAVCGDLFARSDHSGPGFLVSNDDIDFCKKGFAFRFFLRNRKRRRGLQEAAKQTGELKRQGCAARAQRAFQLPCEITVTSLSTAHLRIAVFMQEEAKNGLQGV